MIGQVVEQRQQHHHDRGDRIEIEDQDARRHEQQKPHGLGDAVDRVAVHPLEDAARLLDRRGDHRKPRRGQHEIGRGARRVGRAADSDADVGLLQRRRVVHAVAGHADDVAGALQRLDDLELVLGKHPREAVGGDDARHLRVGPVLAEDGFRRRRYSGRASSCPAISLAIAS